MTSNANFGENTLISSRLEAATGVKLVQRIGRGIRLTPEGQIYAATYGEPPDPPAVAAVLTALTAL